MKSLGIIPARYASTRFPGKPLVRIGRKSMIRRVYERALRAELTDRVVVATDDERIRQHVEDFGGEVMLTYPGHQSGTDRCAEVARAFADYELIINIQGDEPFIDPDQVDQLIQFLAAQPALDIGTMARPLEDPDLVFDPNVVKVVFGKNRRAHYFSRSPIPHVRNTPRDFWPTQSKFYQHLGLYAYRHRALEAISRLEPSPLERSESLEQLRWLEEGFQIGITLTTGQTIAIDTPKDLRRASAWWEERGGEGSGR